jgi:hypothetical protein
MTSPPWETLMVAPLIPVTPSDLVTVPEIVPGLASEKFAVALAFAVTATPVCKLVPKPDAEAVTSYVPATRFEIE